MEPGSFRKGSPVFRDHVMAAKHHIRGGLSLSGIGIYISADQSCRLAFDQTLAVCRLSDGLVAGGTVDYDHRPLSGRLDTGRDRRPDVLADFCRDHQRIQMLFCKKKLGAKWQPLSVKHQKSCLFRSLPELAHLVELPVIGQKCLGDKPQDLSPVEGCRHIVKFPFYGKRYAHKHQGVHFFCMSGDPVKGFSGVCKQNFLGKQIPAGISGDTKLRKYNDPCACLFCLVYIFDDALRIICHVCHPDIRRHSCGLDKSMFHNNRPLYLLL